MANGKRKAFYGKTRKEVQHRLTAALRDQQQGLPILDERQTVAQFLAHWLENSACPTVRPKTYHSYAQLVRLHLAPGLRQLQELASEAVLAGRPAAVPRVVLAGAGAEEGEDQVLGGQVALALDLVAVTGRGLDLVGHD